MAVAAPAARAVHDERLNMTATPSTAELALQYAEKLRPLLPLATRAYGPRTRLSPAHDASRTYTATLVEYRDRGGSLPALASELGVTYASLRRRILTSELEPATRTAGARFRPRAARTPEYEEMLENYVSAIESLKADPELDSAEYHEALLCAYEDGVPPSYLAKRLGQSSTGAIYYGINAARVRRQEEKESLAS